MAEALEEVSVQLLGAALVEAFALALGLLIEAVQVEEPPPKVAVREVLLCLEY